MGVGAKPGVGGYGVEPAHHNGILPTSHAQILPVIVDDLPGHIGHDSAARAGVVHMDRSGVLQVLFSQQHHMV